MRDTDREPVTEAGRRLLSEWQVDELDLVSLVLQMRDRVLAIEAEAALLARRAPGDRDAVHRLSEALQRLMDHHVSQDCHPGDDSHWLAGCNGEQRRAVRALAADSRPEQPRPTEAERRRAIIEIVESADAEDVGADGIADALLDEADRWAVRPEQPDGAGLECPMCGGAGRIVDITAAIEEAQAAGIVMVPLRPEQPAPSIHSHPPTVLREHAAPVRPEEPPE